MAIAISTASIDWLVSRETNEFEQYLEEVGLDNLPRSGTFKTRLELEEAVGALLFFEDCADNDWAAWVASDKKESPVAIMDYRSAFKSSMNHFYHTAPYLSRLNDKRRHCRNNLVNKKLCREWGFFDHDRSGYYIRKEKSSTGKEKHAFSSFFFSSKGQEMCRQIEKSSKAQYNLKDMSSGVTWNCVYTHPACPGKVFINKGDAIRSPELAGYYDPTSKARNAAMVRKTLVREVRLNFGLDDARQESVPVNTNEENIIDNQNKGKWWSDAEPVMSQRVPMKEENIRFAYNERYKQVRIPQISNGTPFTYDVTLAGLHKMLHDLECSEDGHIRFDYYRDKHGRDYETNYWVTNFPSDIRDLLFSDSVSVDIKSATPSCMYWFVTDQGLDESKFPTLLQVRKDPDAFRARLTEPIIAYGYPKPIAMQLAKGMLNYAAYGAKCDPNSIARDLFYHKYCPHLSINKTAHELGIFDADAILAAIEFSEFTAFREEAGRCADYIKEHHIDENNVHTNTIGLQNKLTRRKKGTIMAHEYQGLEARIRDAIYNYPFPTKNGTVPLKDVPGALPCVVHDGFYIKRWAMNVINESGLTLEAHVKNVLGAELTFTYEDTSDNPLVKKYQECSQRAAA